MQWRVMVELSGADGSVQTFEVHVGGCLSAACSAETLGLTQAQAKQLLAELQRHLVQRDCSPGLTACLPGCR
jgi:hypothetical protein